jgi:pre-mRNA-splicing factor ATP-dependent RNA helicase DHX16
VEDDQEEVQTEQQIWEGHQLSYAQPRYGAQDKKNKADDYDFVFEDQIDFVASSTLAGENHESSDSVRAAAGIRCDSAPRRAAQPGASRG